MATEKTWFMSGNVNLNGTSSHGVAQNFMFELYNTLSGGNGNSDAKWEIRSASNGVDAAFSYGPALQPSDFIFNSAGVLHSWFLARKQSMLPQNGESAGRYMYFCADCNESSDYNEAYFSFDYTAPGAGTKLNRPPESADAFEKNGQIFFTGYDEAFPTYYHSVIDTTGSFHVVTARGNVSSNPYRFAMTCARLETPRTGTADPYPVLMKLGYTSTTINYSYMSIGGPWSAKWTNDPAQCDWNDTTNGAAQGMWRVDGTDVVADSITLQMPTIMGTFLSYSYRYSPYSNIGPTASPIDGTWPLMPSYVYGSSGYTTALGLRGRLPDVHMGNLQYYIGGVTTNGAHLNWLAGATIPETGTPTHACVGQYWMPFSASLLPGLA